MKEFRFLIEIVTVFKYIVFIYLTPTKNIIIILYQAKQDKIDLQMFLPADWSIFHRTRTTTSKMMLTLNTIIKLIMIAKQSTNVL